MHSNDSRRFRVALAYDGSDFAGWAKQPGLRTVQGVLESALATVTRHLGGVPVLTVAGRTDAGVHARGQVAHVDLNADQLVALGDRRRDNRDTPRDSQLRTRLRGVLGHTNSDITITEVTEVGHDFDARFSALWRRYEYRLADLGADRDPLSRAHTVWVDYPLDHEAMDAAGRALEGLHDFATFCKAREGATTIRTLQSFRWRRDEHGVLIAQVRADAFCHSMVRSLVGACVAVGVGKLSVGDMADVRDSVTRGSRFVVMPPHGLSLEQVAYPEAAQWAERADLTRAIRD
ncbi:tRNA pseudouridine(38-40) synthase TruA [Klugiella xanthotipulae]|uniref:tRNA pseudouridine synthase A n=1 Tax=Klugiella xanthotipulae TaxID=244735 RepID=A0A543I578_9MICO|nr:tRNA pseudouridine(38-40) synthase TruA [Klugiella xanthotipulae]TQM65737.1 tRNA pseudouridine38-40 synthase [Klugiella xanthotipulae]